MNYTGKLTHIRFDIYHTFSQNYTMELELTEYGYILHNKTKMKFNPFKVKIINNKDNGFVNKLEIIVSDFNGLETNYIMKKNLEKLPKKAKVSPFNGIYQEHYIVKTSIPFHRKLQCKSILFNIKLVRKNSLIFEVDLNLTLNEGKSLFSSYPYLNYLYIKGFIIYKYIFLKYFKKLSIKS